MSLLRFYLRISGEKFNADAYSAAAKQNGLDPGRAKYTNFIPKIRNQDGVEVRFESGFPGTSADSYFIWYSGTYHYATNKETFEKQFDLPLQEYAKLWIPENSAMLEFLTLMKEKMPRVSDYCVGDYFLEFFAIYGIVGENNYICWGLSREVIKLLSEIGACFMSDCEDHEVYFSRFFNSFPA